MSGDQTLIGIHVMRRVSNPSLWPAALVAIVLGMIGVWWWGGWEERSTVNARSGNSGDRQGKEELSDIGLTHSPGGAGRKEAPSGLRVVMPRPRTSFRADADGGSAMVSGVLGVLKNVEMPVRERVTALQSLRGTVLSKEELQKAMEFLAGQGWPDGMAAGDAHWLADELLTALRMQDPAWDGLASALADAAFQPGTDPVIRDYIMQHLGHLWEQYGAREEIESALWKAVETADETTPGTALIALSRGYERDGRAKSLSKVMERAMELAQNPTTPLVSRVTALAIVGESGKKAANQLAESLLNEPATPLILRKVAENVLAR